MSGAPRVVLDTDVVLSALLFSGGRLAPLRPAWQKGKLKPLASGSTAAELIRALAYPKFRLSATEQQELLADCLPYCTTIAIPNRPPRTPLCRDAADLPFLQPAVAGKAAYLVTGDRDLLGIGAAGSCPIVDGGQMLAILNLA